MIRFAKEIGDAILLFIGGVFVFILIPKLSGILAILAFIWALTAIIYGGFRFYYWYQHKTSGYL